MPKEYSSFAPKQTPLSNHQWAKLVRDAVEDLNALLCEANSRDVTVRIEQKIHSIHEYPTLSISTLAENL